MLLVELYLLDLGSLSESFLIMCVYFQLERNIQIMRSKLPNAKGNSIYISVCAFMCVTKTIGKGESHRNYH